MRFYSKARSLLTFSLIAKVEHFFNSGLSFVFMVTAGALSQQSDYGNFGVCVAYAFFVLLASNALVLEPAQIEIGRRSGDQWGGHAVIRVAIEQTLCVGALCFCVLVIPYFSYKNNIILFFGIACMLVTAVFSVLMQLCRRVLLGFGEKKVLIEFALTNSFLALMSLAIMAAYKKNDFLGLLEMYAFWQISSALAGLAFLLYVLKIRSLSYRHQERVPTMNRLLPEIRGYFRKYGFSNVANTPFSWFFGNAIFVMGPAVLSASDVGIFRKVVNFGSPLLQYYSITGILALKNFSENGVASLLHEVRILLVRRFAQVTLYFSIIVLGFYVAARYLDKSFGTDQASFLCSVFLYLIYVFVESFNYVVGSALRAASRYGLLRFMALFPAFCFFVAYWQINQKSLFAFQVMIAIISFVTLLAVCAKWDKK